MTTLTRVDKLRLLTWVLASIVSLLTWYALWRGFAFCYAYWQAVKTPL